MHEAFEAEAPPVDFESPSRPLQVDEIPPPVGGRRGGGGGGGLSMGGAVELARGKHAEYVVRLHADAGAYEWVASEYLRMSGVYWGATALALLGRLGDLDR